MRKIKLFGNYDFRVNGFHCPVCGSFISLDEGERLPAVFRNRFSIKCSYVGDCLSCFQVCDRIFHCQRKFHAGHSEKRGSGALYAHQR